MPSKLPPPLVMTHGQTCNNFKSHPKLTNQTQLMMVGQMLSFRWHKKILNPRVNKTTTMLQRRDNGTTCDLKTIFKSL